MVKVRGSNNCGSGVEGTGFFYSPGRLMTNAHVVAGVDNPEVEVGGSSVPATVVVYDPETRRRRAGCSTRATCRTWCSTSPPGPRTASPCSATPRTGPTTCSPAASAPSSGSARPTSTARAPCIRQVFSLRALIRPGNSGGPIVTSAGDVAGMVFAASVTDPDTGYALTAEQISESAALGVTASAEVDTGTCVR